MFVVRQNKSLKHVLANGRILDLSGGDIIPPDVIKARLLCEPGIRENWGHLVEEVSDPEPEAETGQKRKKKGESNE